jgi:hypothetical protein
VTDHTEMAIETERELFHRLILQRFASDKPMSDVTRDDVRALAESLEADARAGLIEWKDVREAWNLTRGMFADWASENPSMNHDPARGVRPPRWPAGTGTHLYFIDAIDNSGGVVATKVGRTSDIGGRLRALQTNSPHKLRVRLVVPWAGECEPDVHRALAELRRPGTEWFMPGRLLADAIMRIRLLCVLGQESSSDLLRGLLSGQEHEVEAWASAWKPSHEQLASVLSAIDEFEKLEG